MFLVSVYTAHSLDLDTRGSLFSMGEELGLFNTIQNDKGDYMGFL
jgi:hypothetical protein